MANSVLVADIPRPELQPLQHPDSAATSTLAAAFLAEAGLAVSAPSLRVIVFDWDDTIMPTSFLAMQGLYSEQQGQVVEVPESTRAELYRLEELVLALLECAMSLGEVLLVTNAENGWIEMSAGRFLPRVLMYLRKFAIPMISARSMYEALAPTDPNEWKVRAFYHEIHCRFGSVQKLNLLSIGDGLSERVAAHTLAPTLPSSFVKTVKLVERPNLYTLQRELHLITATLGDLFYHEASFDINLVS